MNALRAVIVCAFVAVLAVPFMLTREAEQLAPSGARRLIVVTPHIEQIRLEFARAFDRWHRRRYGEPVQVDYRTPGGTTEILQLLSATYSAALNRALESVRTQNASAILDPKLDLGAGLTKGSADFDVMFGGGTYDHDLLRRRGVSVLAALPAGTAATEVMVARPRDRLDPQGLGSLRDLETDVTWEGRTLRLNIPISAINGGGAALAPLAQEGGPKAAPLTIDLARCRRVLVVRMSAQPEPAFSDEELRAVYGDNILGAGKVWQDDRGPKAGGGFERPSDWQHWFGVALSGFGLVFNRDRCAALGVPEPRSFDDLARPEFANQLALADPRQSGSVATLYDSILNEAARRGLADAKARGATPAEGLSVGWDRGWRVLREMAANARYFSSASTQPPMDVSQGDAAAGVAIDFYGRGQAQAILKPGEQPADGRMGYVDPAGAVYIDADPVSILRGAPNPDLARHFVEFCFTPEAQALWQLPPVGLDGQDPQGRANPTIPGDAQARRMGPAVYRLRRLPALRVMYDPSGPYWPLLADRVDPFTLASSAVTQGWRDSMIVMFGAWIDAGDELRRAWSALCAARADPDFPRDRLTEMESAFYAFPEHTLASGQRVRMSLSTYRIISDDVRAWRDPKRGALAKIEYAEFFRAQFRRVAELGRGAHPRRTGTGAPQG